MNQNPLNTRQLARLAELLQPFEPAAVYLYGSAASGRVHPGSDIDIAFLPTSPADPVECFEVANQLADVFGCHVDLLDLSRASVVMAKEVIRTGRLLDSANDLARRDFEMRTLSDYARLNEQRGPVLAR